MHVAYSSIDSPFNVGDCIEKPSEKLLTNLIVNTCDIILTFRCGLFLVVAEALGALALARNTALSENDCISSSILLCAANRSSQSAYVKSSAFILLPLILLEKLSYPTVISHRIPISYTGGFTEAKSYRLHFHGKR